MSIVNRIKIFLFGEDNLNIIYESGQKLVCYDIERIIHVSRSNNYKTLRDIIDYLDKKKEEFKEKV